MRNPRYLTAFAAVYIVMSIGVAHATLLQDRFGVTLLLDTANSFTDIYQGTTSYPMLQSSYTPTKNTATVDWVVDDWWGSWSDTDLEDYSSAPGAGQHPAGSEPYDIEAIYFDNDDDYLYIAVVTSLPQVPGYFEDRVPPDDILVVSGDLALDLGLNTPYSDGFRYDYGVNVNNEIRPTNPFDDATANATPAVGDDLYRTANSDWYLGTPSAAVDAGGELTNFDPDFTSFSGSYVGDVTVDYYQYTFSGGLQETLHPTYVVEFTLPIDYFAEFVYGQTIGISFIEGCRNDSSSIEANIRLYGSTPEPGTIVLLSMGVAGLVVVRRRRKDKTDA